VTSVGLTMVPSGDEAGTDEMPALRPTGGEIAISVGAVVVLYVVVLAGVVFVRYLRRPTRAGTRAAGG
jgi:Ni/Fe-hydrogenase subunit HybB-like protein